MTIDTLPLAGEAIVVTGVVDGLKRWEVDSVIVENGGVAQDKVTKDTTLVVVGERPGQVKLTDAEKFGVETITEAEFRQRVGR